MYFPVRFDIISVKSSSPTMKYQRVRADALNTVFRASAFKLPKVKTFGRRILGLASATKPSLADALGTSNEKFWFHDSKVILALNSSPKKYYKG